MKPDLIGRAQKATAYLASSDARLMRECADALQAAQTAVAELPELSSWTTREDIDEANAKRLAARKAVGLEG